MAWSRSNNVDLNDAYDWLEDQLNGFDGYEESTVHGMLESGANPKAILNKIRKDRSAA